MIFVNLPVADLAKSRAFLEGLGAVNEPKFTDDTAACMATADGTALGCPFHPSVHPGLLSRHRTPLYRAMSDTMQGPVAAEMCRRLEAALKPTVLTLRDDSEQHRGHGGYNPEGESHFSLLIESAAFIGKSRVERQRLVHAALGDLLKERVHALSITAREPQS